MKNLETDGAIIQKRVDQKYWHFNMTIPKLKLLLRDAEIPPACNQMELHPSLSTAGAFSILS